MKKRVENGAEKLIAAFAYPDVRKREYVNFNARSITSDAEIFSDYVTIDRVYKQLSTENFNKLKVFYLFYQVTIGIIESRGKRRKALMNWIVAVISFLADMLSYFKLKIWKISILLNDREVKQMSFWEDRMVYEYDRCSSYK